MYRIVRKAFLKLVFLLNSSFHKKCFLETEVTAPSFQMLCTNIRLYHLCAWDMSEQYLLQAERHTFHMQKRDYSITNKSFLPRRDLGS